MIKKLKNGRYQVRWRDRSKAQRAKNFRGIEAARVFLRELDKAEEEQARGAELDFEAFAEMWHRDYCKVEKAESQWLDDLQIIRNHLLPAFAPLKIASLTKHDLAQLRGNLKKAGGRSNKTINNITGLARKMMETAVDWELIRANPFAGIKPLPRMELPVNFWTIEQRERFLRFCRRTDEAFADVVEFACHTGLRQGEISGLTRGAIDFDRRVVVVKRGYSYKLHKELDYTKTKRWREIEMNEVVQRICLKFRLMPASTRVFTANLHHSAEKLRRIAKAAEVPEIRFHDLRHGFASHLAMAGVSLQKIQRLLGHSSAKQTEAYAHLLPDATAGLTALLVHQKCIPETQAANVSEIKGKISARSGT